MEKMRRKVFASKEMGIRASRAIGKKIEIYSFFPVDRADCECRKMVIGWKKRLALLPEKKRQAEVMRQEVLVCPRNKTGMSRYQITCNNCSETLGYCWAYDETLTDWCDLHYTNWVERHEIRKKGKKIDYEYLWHGCLGHHISPITEQLCWECLCGEDTRDFRANMTLPAFKAYEIEEKNKIGREFGKADSKFKAIKVSKNVILFK